jgi:ABC-type polysaccharide/polyol phosphate export permease
MLIFVLVMGVIYSRLFSQNVSEYLPFFSAGFLFWTFISSTINESADLFKSNSGFVKQIKLPYNLYIFKLLTRNVIVLVHNLAAYFLVAGYYRINLGWDFFFLIPGFLFLIFNLYWITLFVSLIGARFRDMVPIINTFVQIVFFVTPISWMPKLLENSKIIRWNPFVYLLDLVRLPLLGGVPPLHTWVVAFCLAIGGFAFSASIFCKVRSHIPFWVD